MTHSSPSSIPLLPGETWWGGRAHSGVEMPFGEHDRSIDLHHDSGNQLSPLLLSNRGRYLWCEDPYRFAFRNRHIEIQSYGRKVECQEGFGDLRGAYLAAMKAHFPPSQKLPNLLALTAPQYNTWIEMKYEPTQDKVLAYARSILDRGYPPGVLMIDDNWMNDYGNWTFHPGRFPDPKKMMDALHAMGFQIVLWVCPYLSADSLISRALDKENLLVRKSTGELYLRKWWNGYSALLDLDLPAAGRWFKSQLDSLITAFGVDGFKFDAGDPVTSDELTRRSPGHTPNSDCERYASVGLDYGLSELRECWKMGNQPLLQRLRDKKHSWDRKDGLQSLIPNGIAQSLMGHLYHCPDMIGGGEDTEFHDGRKLDPELFVRSAQCQTLFPMMQFSLAPWKAVGPGHLPAVAKCIELRKKFAPEIETLARVASRTGEPFFRPVFYDHPGFAESGADQQFLLGPDLLVAPVTEKGVTEKTVHFPPGKWRDENGNIHSGPSVETVPAPLEVLPYFRKV